MSDRPKLHDVEVLTASMQPVSLRKLLADLGIETPEGRRHAEEAARREAQALGEQIAQQVQRLEVLMRQLKEATTQR